MVAVPREVRLAHVHGGFGLLVRWATKSRTTYLYGTRGQNKIRDVVRENVQTNKRTNSENSSSRYKAHRALYRDEEF